MYIYIQIYILFNVWCWFPRLGYFCPFVVLGRCLVERPNPIALRGLGATANIIGLWNWRFIGLQRHWLPHLHLETHMVIPWPPRLVACTEALSCEYTSWLTLVGGLDGFYFIPILGIIFPTDFHIFQRHWNHQPVLSWLCCKECYATWLMKD